MGAGAGARGVAPTTVRSGLGRFAAQNESV